MEKVELSKVPKFFTQNSSTFDILLHTLNTQEELGIRGPPNSYDPKPLRQRNSFQCTDNRRKEVKEWKHVKEDAGNAALVLPLSWYFEYYFHSWLCTISPNNAGTSILWFCIMAIQKPLFTLGP